jgi:hypothetical protein
MFLKKHRKLTASWLILILLSFDFGPASAWGFYSHRKINEMAVYALPKDLFGFYKKNIQFIIDQSVAPDKRRYGVKGEAPRHFIDIDHYCHDEACDPFEVVPVRWNDAVEKFSEDTLQEYGILPWHINSMTHWLTKAFKEKDIDNILRLSAELGHYVGDAHVPLHTTENYNGQMSGQRGIHGFWETRLPELYDDHYDYFVEDAAYVESPLNFAWKAVRESHTALDSVLTFEEQLNDRFSSDQKYSYEERGRSVVKVYSQEYSRTYHQMLDGQVERRLRGAIHSIASLWYTAWVNAGQPDLTDIEKEQPSEELLQELEKETKKKELEEKVRDHDQ